MEIAPYAAGWLSILPPIIAIGLALVTKEVLSSLLLGVLSGSLIWAIGTGANPVMGTVSATFGIMVNKLDFTIILFTSMLGALVYCISLSGATKAYGNWALSKIKSRRGALMSTTGLGICIFIDDYFSCLTTGTVMRPVTDAHRISRAKLAYLVDTTAAPVCIIAPISTTISPHDKHLFGHFVSPFQGDISYNKLFSNFLNTEPDICESTFHNTLKLKPVKIGKESFENISE